MPVYSALGKWRRHMLVVFTAVMIVACGGGSSSGSGPGVTTLLFYTLEDGSGNISLHAVDPADPGNPLEVTPAPVSLAVTGVSAGTYKDGAVHGAHKAWVVYGGSDGHLYRVSTDPDATTGTPESVQISSESNAAELCDLRVIPDYATVADSAVTYELGSGGDCLSTTRHVVRLGAGPADDPVAINLWPRSQVRDEASGALLELVARQGSEMRHFDMDSRTWRTAHDIDPQGTTTYTIVFSEGAFGEMLLRSSGSPPEHLIYDPVAEDSLAVASGADVPDNPFGLVGSTGLGMRERMVLSAGMSPPNLYKLDFAEAGPELSLLATGQGTVSGRIVTATREYVAWNYEISVSEEQLDSVSLEDGSVTPLVTADLAVSRIESARAPDQWVYYSDWDGGISSTAVDIRGSGFGTVALDESVGNTWSPTVPPAGYRARRILLTDGTRMTSVKATSPAGGERDHGALPNGLGPPGRAASHAPAALVQMRRDDLEGDDLVYVNTLNAGSLVRVTDTVDSASPVEGF